ncbi:MAG: insulinase family protein [Planctomycetes bacterium]|nr:insulinase family protein [Planctomycetota bacterium]
MRSYRPFLLVASILAACAAALVVGPGRVAADSTPAAALAKGVVRETLPNGLRIALKERHACPVVTTLIEYHVGSVDEVAGRTGLSHYLEHMLFKGTDRYKRGDIDLLTMKNGGSNNAFTTEDATGYHFDFASDRWEIALEIEANRMRNCTFDAREVDAERNVVIEELKQDLDAPTGLLDIKFGETMFTAHPYRFPIIGYEADLKKEGRDEFYGHYNKYYVPNNAVLVIVGDVDAAKVLPKVRDLFGKIPRGPEIVRSVTPEPPQTAERRFTLQHGTTNDYFRVGFHTCKIGDPEDYALDIINAVLTAGRSSRLHRKLVEEEKLAASVESSNDIGQYPKGFFVDVDVNPGKDRDRVEKLVLDELAKLASEPVTDREMEKAKNGIEAATLFGRETTNALATDLALHEVLGNTDYMEKYAERIRAVTKEHVLATAKKYFTKENRTVGWCLAEKDEEEGKGESNAPTGSGKGGSGAETPPKGDHRAAPGARPWVGLRRGRAAFRSMPGVSPAGPGPGAPPVQPPAPPVQPAAPPAQPPAAGLAPTPKAPPPFSLGEIRRVVLDNGLTLLLRPNHDLPLVSLAAFVNAGALYEPEEKAGLSSLLGQCLSEGAGRRTGPELAEAIEFVGGGLATSGTGVAAKVLSRDLDLALELVSDVLQNATFPPEALEKERAKALVAIKTQEDEPETVAAKLLNEFIYKGHPAHRSAMGTEDTVKALTRDDLLAHYRAFFRPNNTTLAISGDFDSGRMVEAVTARFKGWEKAPIARPELPALTRGKKAQRRYLTMDTEQAVVLLGHLGIRRNNPDFPALRVMDYVLGTGTGFTDRLSKRLRDELGLAYTVRANITDTAGLEPGIFEASIGTQAKNVKKAIREMRKVFRGILTTAPTEEEVANARDYLTGSYVTEFETNDLVVAHLLEVERYGLGADYFNKYLKEIAAVTSADVKRVAATYLDPRALHLVAAGRIDEDGDEVSVEGEEDGSPEGDGEDADAKGEGVGEKKDAGKGAEAPKGAGGAGGEGGK